MTAPVLDQQAAVALDATAARAATDRLTLTLTDAHAQLIDLWRGKAHEALGYGKGLQGWQAYLGAEFGALLNVLPTPDQLGAMRDAGMSQREIAAPFGVSLGTVNARLQARAAATPVVEPEVDARPTYARIADLVAAAGVKGLTIPQAVRRSGWTYGAVSGALSRAEGKGLVVRLFDPDARRGGYRPYVAPH